MHGFRAFEIIVCDVKYITLNKYRTSCDIKKDLCTVDRASSWHWSRINSSMHWEEKQKVWEQLFCWLTGCQDSLPSKPSYITLLEGKTY